jgi:hypothetical protein
MANLSVAVNTDAPFRKELRAPGAPILALREHCSYQKVSGRPFLGISRKAHVLRTSLALYLRNPLVSRMPGRPDAPSALRAYFVSHLSYSPAGALTHAPVSPTATANSAESWAFTASGCSGGRLVSSVPSGTTLIAATCPPMCGGARWASPGRI